MEPMPEPAPRSGDGGDDVPYQPSVMFPYPEVFTLPIVIFRNFVLLFFIFGRHSSKLFVFSGFGSSVGIPGFPDFSSHGEALVQVPDAVAMGSVILLLVALLGRKHIQIVNYIMLLCKLNLCFALYGLVVLAFLPTKGGLGSLTVTHAPIVLMALAWDVISSAETIAMSTPRISHESRASDCSLLISRRWR